VRITHEVGSDEACSAGHQKIARMPVHLQRTADSRNTRSR
jgi:hypothetical protein